MWTFELSSPDYGQVLFSWQTVWTVALRESSAIRVNTLLNSTSEETVKHCGLLTFSVLQIKPRTARMLGNHYYWATLFQPIQTDTKFVQKNSCYRIHTPSTSGAHSWFPKKTSAHLQCVRPCNEHLILSGLKIKDPVRCGEGWVDTYSVTLFDPAWTGFND